MQITAPSLFIYLNVIHNIECKQYNAFVCICIPHANVLINLLLYIMYIPYTSKKMNNEINDKQPFCYHFLYNNELFVHVMMTW